MAKAATYDDLEEELYAELYRRESENEKGGGINQLKGKAENKENEATDDVDWTEMTCWNQELGWIQVLAPSAKRARIEQNQGTKNG